MKFYDITMFRSFALLSILGMSFCANAQFGDLSPYSRFGLGTIQNQALAANIGMGGLSTAINSNASINVLNPATYASLTKPTFQVELKSQWLTLSNDTESQSLRLTTLNSFNFAFPFLKSKSALSLGILPYSRSGYSIVQTNTDPDVGAYTSKYEGEGGLNKAYLGYGKAFDVRKSTVIRDTLGAAIDTITQLKHLISIGANFNYYFGTLLKTRSLEFDDTDYFNSRFSSSTNIHDVGFDFGVHYFTTIFEERKRTELIHKVNLFAGITYSLASKLNVQQTDLAESYRLFSGIPSPLDTSYFVENANGNLTIPELISAGLAFEYQNKNDRSLLIGAEFRYQDWTDFSVNFDGAETVDKSLDQSTQIALGLQYTPKFLPKPGLNLFQKMSYRVGFRTNDMYISLNDQNLREDVLTAGFSIPLDVSRSSSKINFGIEFGNRGGTNNGLVKEEFINVQLGFTFTPYYRNNWFVQSKYD